MTERGSILRRDINDLIRSPDGKVSEAKTYVVVFKAAMMYVFLTHTEIILADWGILTVFVVALVAPELLKKLLVARYGGLESERTERVEHTERTTTDKRNITP